MCGNTVRKRNSKFLIYMTSSSKKSWAEGMIHTKFCFFPRTHSPGQKVQHGVMGHFRTYLQLYRNCRPKSCTAWPNISLVLAHDWAPTLCALMSGGGGLWHQRFFPFIVVGSPPPIREHLLPKTFGPQYISLLIARETLAQRTKISPRSNISSNLHLHRPSLPSAYLSFICKYPPFPESPASLLKPLPPPLPFSAGITDFGEIAFPFSAQLASPPLVSTFPLWFTHTRPPPSFLSNRI